MERIIQGQLAINQSLLLVWMRAPKVIDYVKQQLTLCHNYVRLPIFSVS
jgi:hypothetical protein